MLQKTNLNQIGIWLKVVFVQMTVRRKEKKKIVSKLHLEWTFNKVRVLSKIAFGIKSLKK